MDLATSVETLGIDPRTKTAQLGAKEETRRTTCDVRFSFARKVSSFPDEVIEDGLGSCESVERSSL